MKGEKDPKKLAKMQQDQMMLRRMLDHLEKNGELTPEQQKELQDYIESDPEVAARFKSKATVVEATKNCDYFQRRILNFYNSRQSQPKHKFKSQSTNKRSILFL